MKFKLAALAATSLLLTAATAASAQPVHPDAASKGAPPPFARGEQGPREITKEAFLARAAKNFEEMDTNRDGKLDREEMRAFHEKQREQRGKGPQGGPPPGGEGGPRGV